MNYKEKHAHHLHRALKVTALVMAAMLPLACAEKKEQETQTQEYGLLDKSPLKSHDKYNAEVVLYSVDVPVYNCNGERRRDQYVLTHGLKKSIYHSKNAERYVRKAYLNGAKEATYVKVDDNYAVETKQGFVGLFLDENSNVVVVSDKHVNDFIKERAAQKFESRQKNFAYQNGKDSRMTTIDEDSIQYSEAADSINDVILMPADTLRDSSHPQDNDKTPNDTLRQIRQEIRE